VISVASHTIAFHSCPQVLTKFECNLLAAEAQKDRDPSVEYDLRFKSAEAAHDRRLAKKSVEGRAQSVPSEVCMPREPPEMSDPREVNLDQIAAVSQSPESDSDEDVNKTVLDPRHAKNFDPVNWEITSVPLSTLHKVIKKKGVRFSKSQKETNCPLHNKGPVAQKEQDLLETKLAKLQHLSSGLSQGSDDLQKLRSEAEVLKSRLSNVKKLVGRYILHLEQYEAQRKVVQEILDSLVPGQAVLFRDFVNSYNHEGKHIKNLQLVIRWRDKKGGPLQTYRIPNICTNTETFSCDTYFYKDVLEHHLRARKHGGSGVFEELGCHKIYIVGDHGPHFSSEQAFWAESTWKKRFNIDIEPVFLCSYHAYNPCDGAGAHNNRVERSYARAGRGGDNAFDYARHINESSSDNCHAVPWDTIARGEDVFPSKSDFIRVKNLRKACHVRYDIPLPAGGASAQKSVFIEGVMMYKFKTPDPKWSIADLVCKPKFDATHEPLCLACSAFHQCAIFGASHHENRECVGFSETGRLNKDELSRRLPGHNRLGLTGPQILKQVNAKPKKPAKAPKAAKPFPCKLLGCKKGYASAKRANTHMRQEHPYGAGTQESPQPLAFYVEPARVSAPKRKRKVAHSRKSSSSPAKDARPPTEDSTDEDAADGDMEEADERAIMEALESVQDSDSSTEADNEEETILESSGSDSDGEMAAADGGRLVLAFRRKSWPEAFYLADAQTQQLLHGSRNNAFKSIWLDESDPSLDPPPEVHDNDEARARAMCSTSDRCMPFVVEWAPSEVLRERITLDQDHRLKAADRQAIAAAIETDKEVDRDPASRKRKRPTSAAAVSSSDDEPSSDSNSTLSSSSDDEDDTDSAEPEDKTNRQWYLWRYAQLIKEGKRPRQAESQANQDQSEAVGSTGGRRPRRG
jgi:hypothetical protein